MDAATMSLELGCMNAAFMQYEHASRGALAGG